MNIPKHIGIIPDGNRRWAKEKGLPTLEGHRKGFDAVKRISQHAFEKGVKVFTVWCFSTENWSRSEQEVSYLMNLLSNALVQKEIEQYHNRGVKIRIIGQKERLSSITQERIKQAEDLTKNNEKGTLVLAISYGGRPEIIQAVKNIVKNNIPSEEINEETINQNLWTKGLVMPDLIIRAGGNHRLSGFFSWQSFYSELYFLDKYWPNFTEQDLDKAIEYYSNCQRNFGK